MSKKKSASAEANEPGDDVKAPKKSKNVIYGDIETGDDVYIDRLESMLPGSRGP